MISALRGIFFISLTLIFYLSLVPASELVYFNSLSFIGDKISHVVIFFYISLLGMFCNFKIKYYILMAIIFSFGLTIEIVHYFHPFRYFEWTDLLANFLGIILARAAYYSFKKNLKTLLN
tara:strand:- start:266 stop:625 length:360 start_codon:yes stop_codon:yes gene_type:complete